ncbi:MAG TPA: hypothetical protein VHB77_19675, partial [Planctomycetaceae bacterium]|nr:hypothetical protein [Planctomycetaceae bacterium]
AHPCDDETKFDQLKERWGVFPLVRLRPEQMIGAILQSTSPSTIDQNSHLFVRTVRFFRENDFVKEYGDLGEDELQDRPGTIPQALLRMNGNLIKELTKSNPFGTTGRISGLAANDENAVEVAFLVCVTRRPNPEETAVFSEQLKGSRGPQREEAVEDLLWSLFNSPEFCWNH